MSDYRIYLYILVAGLVTYLIRVLPLTIIKKPIKNVFLKSFLYYVPYVTLSVMTFPAIMYATQSSLAGLLSLIVGVIAAFFGLSLFPVSLICCVVVFVIEKILM